MTALARLLAQDEAEAAAEATAPEAPVEVLDQEVEVAELLSAFLA